MHIEQESFNMNANLARTLHKKHEKFIPGSRVDLHRPKMLIIQFHTLSLWKNASHTNFIHFCKMRLIKF